MIQQLVVGSFTIALISTFVTAEEASSDSAAAYTLKKDDVIRMTVFQEEDLETEAQIGKSGSISFPLIGSVQLIGLSVANAEQKIEALYEQDYLVNARVNVSLVAYAEKWVIVGGDVTSPGTIKMPEEGALDLRGAIAQAGGLTDSGDSSSIVVRSKSGNIRTLSLDGSGGVTLKHGDSVTVRPNTLNQSTVTVAGQITSPGTVEFPKAGGLDIITAIAKAGGFTRIANSKEVLVRRGESQYEVSLRDIERGKLKMFYLKPGDLVTVQESRW